MYGRPEDMPPRGAQVEAFFADPPEPVDREQAWRNEQATGIQRIHDEVEAAITPERMEAGLRDIEERLRGEGRDLVDSPEEFRQSVDQLHRQRREEVARLIHEARGVLGDDADRMLADLGPVYLPEAHTERLGEPDA